MMKTIVLLGVLSSGSAFATGITGGVACPSASLSQYASSFPDSGSPCTVGPVGFYGFSYSPVSPSSLGNLAGDIMIHPEGGGLFISSPFSSLADLQQKRPDLITAGFPVSWLIRYSEDPAPILTGEELTLDPPSGAITVTESICIPSYLGGTDLACTGVFVMAVTPESPTAFVTYPHPVSRVDIELLVELNGDFSGFGGTLGTPTFIPEPGTAALAAFGVIALCWLRRLRK